jgi:hypothetical protein
MNTILLSVGFVLLCFYFYDSDGFSATLFGKENKSYFVDENSGWPYKSYKKEPGYEYFIKDNISSHGAKHSVARYMVNNGAVSCWSQDFPIDNASTPLFFLKEFH